jgi:hypothetical protein
VVGATVRAPWYSHHVSVHKILEGACATIPDHDLAADIRTLDTLEMVTERVAAAPGRLRRSAEVHRTRNPPSERASPVHNRRNRDGRVHDCRENFPCTSMEMADRGHLRRLCEVMLTANDDFFSTTAQIIPVVILALVVEDRYVRRHALIPPKWTAFLQSAIMSVLTAGEVAALAGVLGYRNLATVALVLGVLGFSGAQLVLPIVYHNLSTATAPATTADRILTVVSTLLVDGDTTPFTVDEIEPADPDRWTQTQLPLLQDASVRKSVARSMTVHPHCDGQCTYPASP